MGVVGTLWGGRDGGSGEGGRVDGGWGGRELGGGESDVGVCGCVWGLTPSEDTVVISGLKHAVKMLTITASATDLASLVYWLYICVHWGGGEGGGGRGWRGAGREMAVGG